MNLSITDYFIVQFKSTPACPKFYSPSINETTLDADGSQVVRFGDASSDDTRTRPRAIFIPSAPAEQCPPKAYVNFNDDAVADGAPRLLTEEQYATATASVTPDSPSDVDSDSAQA